MGRVVEGGGGAHAHLPQGPRKEWRQGGRWMNSVSLYCTVPHRTVTLTAMCPAPQCALEESVLFITPLQYTLAPWRNLYCLVLQCSTPWHPGGICTV